ncbi:uncharacterized protein EI90DRAFT_3126894 [Cantharellus anzutake]|uniref:uncharacterized protein n=1 Tax=Cantharellus anzutake TaxID=1750568 RepID=UPI0019068453|nr:uncharacterized protein EI90DRAFT_3126894 [Cantharellus anzutake]KAF8327571.1 hypothetical protein EI90DRAFT_3126894 [Cantharellus anzutake]
MPVHRKCHRANNLGEYSKKKPHNTTPGPNLMAHEDSRLGNFGIEPESDSRDSQSEAENGNEDGLGNCDIEPESNSDDSQSGAEDWNEDVDITYFDTPLAERLSKAEDVLSHLINKCGAIPGNKVRYAGTTINGTPAECTRCYHAAKQRATKKGIQEAIKKTVSDGKKWTLHDFFH